MVHKIKIVIQYSRQACIPSGLSLEFTREFFFGNIPNIEEFIF